MAYYIGIDAGGTKTTCALADETSVLAYATAGSIKVMRVSEQEAEANLSHILDSVTRESGVSLSHIASTCIGLAGITVTRVEQWTRNALQARLPGKLQLCSDEKIALDAAFFGGVGVLVLAGTGSNIVGRTDSGEVFHLGGWGPVLSDEGSGYWIGLHAVRTVIRAEERNIPTALQAAIFAEWKISTMAELVDIGNRIPGPDFSQLAPIVATCADAGDTVALLVLEQAGEQLAAMAIEAFEKISAEGAATPRLRMAFAGSILKNISVVRESLIATVRESVPTVELHTEPVEPVMGALWRARRI